MQQTTAMVDTGELGRLPDRKAHTVLVAPRIPVDRNSENAKVLQGVS